MRYRARVNNIFKKNSWVIVTIELQKHVICLSIFDIIIYKLSYWQKVCLVILFLIYKKFEICLYCTNLSFYLAIDQKMKGCKEFLFDS